MGTLVGDMTKFVVSGTRVPIITLYRYSAELRLIEKRRSQFHVVRQQRENFISRRKAAIA